MFRRATFLRETHPYPSLEEEEEEEEEEGLFIANAVKEEEDEEEEEEESLFKADKEEEESLSKANAVNEEDPDRDRALSVLATAWLFSLATSITLEQTRVSQKLDHHHLTRPSRLSRVSRRSFAGTTPSSPRKPPHSPRRRPQISRRRHPAPRSI